MVLLSGHRNTAERMAAYCILSRSIYNYENYDEILTNPGICCHLYRLAEQHVCRLTIRATNTAVLPRWRRRSRGPLQFPGGALASCTCI